MNSLTFSLFFIVYLISFVKAPGPAPPPPPPDRGRARGRGRGGPPPPPPGGAQPRGRGGTPPANGRGRGVSSAPSLSRGTGSTTGPGKPESIWSVTSRELIKGELDSLQTSPPGPDARKILDDPECNRALIAVFNIAYDDLDGGGNPYFPVSEETSLPENDLLKAMKPLFLPTGPTAFPHPFQTIHDPKIRCQRCSFLFVQQTIQAMGLYMLRALTYASLVNDGTKFPTGLGLPAFLLDMCDVEDLTMFAESALDVYIPLTKAEAEQLAFGPRIFENSDHSITPNTQTFDKDDYKNEVRMRTFTKEELTDNGMQALKVLEACFAVSKQRIPLDYINHIEEAVNPSVGPPLAPQVLSGLIKILGFMTSDQVNAWHLVDPLLWGLASLPKPDCLIEALLTMDKSCRELSLGDKNPENAELFNLRFNKSNYTDISSNPVLERLVRPDAVESILKSSGDVDKMIKRVIPDLSLGYVLASIAAPNDVDFKNLAEQMEKRKLGEHRVTENRSKIRIGLASILSQSQLDKLSKRLDEYVS